MQTPEYETAKAWPAFVEALAQDVEVELVRYQETDGMRWEGGTASATEPYYVYRVQREGRRDLSFEITVDALQHLDLQAIWDPVGSRMLEQSDADWMRVVRNADRAMLHYGRP